jgi:hypothetical protein
MFRLSLRRVACSFLGLFLFLGLVLTATAQQKKTTKPTTQKKIAAKPSSKKAKETPEVAAVQQDTSKTAKQVAEKLNSQTDKFLTSTEAPTIELNTKRSIAEKEKQLKKELGDLFKKGKIKIEKVKKEPKNTYKGIKGKKTFVKTESQNSNRVIIEKFYFVKESQAPPAFVADIYYFDPNKRKIIRTTKFDASKGFLMHGLYTKKISGLLTEEGYFYLGAKDGRWQRYSKDTLLTDKRYFDKGFLQESEVSYFDKNKKNLRQLVSIHNGAKEGEYLLYYPSGRMAAKGQYAEDSKIGIWYEYYDQVKFARKSEIKFKDSPYEQADQDSTIIRQWDEKGKLLIDNSRKKTP